MIRHIILVMLTVLSINAAEVKEDSKTFYKKESKYFYERIDSFDRLERVN